MCVCECMCLSLCFVYCIRVWEGGIDWPIAGRDTHTCKTAWFQPLEALTTVLSPTIVNLLWVMFYFYFHFYCQGERLCAMPAE
jgi:hypothetical protein